MSARISHFKKSDREHFFSRHLTEYFVQYIRKSFLWRYDKKRRLKYRRRWSLKPKNAEAFFFYRRHSRFLRIARNRSVLISSLHGCLQKMCIRTVSIKIACYDTLYFANSTIEHVRRSKLRAYALVARHVHD